jgi:hypothetical protein
MISESLINFFFWLFFLVMISFFLGFLWSKIFTGKKYQMFLFPGVIVHELSHALGCLIARADIKEIKILSSKGSYVSHTKPRLPLIGNFIVSFAPIVGGIAVVILSFWAFNYQAPKMDFLNESLFDSFFSLVKQAGTFSLNHYDSWIFWIFSYIVLSVVVCLVPSKQDLKNSFLSLIFVGLVFWALSFFSFSTGIINGFLISALGITVFFGFVAVLITLPIYFIKKIIL